MTPIGIQLDGEVADGDAALERTAHPQGVVGFERGPQLCERRSVSPEQPTTDVGPLTLEPGDPDLERVVEGRSHSVESSTT